MLVLDRSLRRPSQGLIRIDRNIKNEEIISKIERDENISKNGCRQRQQLLRSTSEVNRRPLEKLSLVDVIHEKLSLVDVDNQKSSIWSMSTTIKAQSGRRRSRKVQWHQRRPLTVDVYESSVWSTSTVDGRGQAVLFITPSKILKY